MRLFLIVMVSLLFVSCKKDTVNKAKNIEFYLLESYPFVAGKCLVDPALAVLQDTALILNRDIIAYSKTKHQFTLTEEGMQKINALTDKIPFAVTVDNEVIYYCIYKSWFSSSSCHRSITILWASDNKITMNLGYPGQMQGIPIDDRRNDIKLITALLIQGKLRR